MSFKISNDHRHHIHQSERLKTNQLVFIPGAKGIDYGDPVTFDNLNVLDTPIQEFLTTPVRTIKFNFNAGVLVAGDQELVMSVAMTGANLSLEPIIVTFQPVSSFSNFKFSVARIVIRTNSHLEVTVVSNVPNYNAASDPFTVTVFIRD